MNENENLQPVQKLTPFTKMVMSIGTLPSSFYASMSYYEAMVWLYEYLKNSIIPTVNNNGEAVEELQEKFLELKEWTETYTEETIPTEIENQLDEMVEDGTFTKLISTFTQLSFNSLIEMKEAENLKNGSFAKTFGFYEFNDGGGANYKIRLKTIDDIIDNMFIIGLHDSTLIAEYIEPIEYNVKTLGAYGDNIHDDTNIIKAIIKHSYNKELQSGYRRGKTIFFPKGKYLISSSLINNASNVDGLSIKFRGENSYGSVISFTGECLFYNDDIFGFTEFNNLFFNGSNNQFMYFNANSKGNAQSLTFNNVIFNNWHNIIETDGTIMTSEVTFNECKIALCGTNESLCTLFIINNPQGVNWRFYATDIENITGIIYKYLKGSSIYYYQGSIIPLTGSTVIDATEADSNYFGSTNSPNINMNGVRFELRGNTKLYNKGTSIAEFIGTFNECGMGGYNLSTSFQTIDLGAHNTKLYFNNCYNLQKYGIKAATTLVNTTPNTMDLLYFNNTDINIQNVINNSNASYTGTNKSYLPLIFVNDLCYSLNKIRQDSKHQHTMNQNLLAWWDQEGTDITSSGNPVTREFYIGGFVKSIHIDNDSRAAFGSDATYTVECFSNDTSLGSVTELIQSHSSNEITVNRYIETLRIVTTSSYGTVSVIIPLLISVDRL